MGGMQVLVTCLPDKVPARDATMSPLDWGYSLFGTFLLGTRLVMHELSIAQSIVDTVEARAVECKAARVKSVRLRVGAANSIVADSLTFCFEMIASLDPTLAGAQLLIDPVAHRARCPHCDKEFPVINFIAQCPTCEEWSNEIISGNELQILEMEIETSP